jgi:hypothetical protein
MSLEEQALERVGDRCEVCGVRLTPAEQRAVLERGGPVLCTVHMAEFVGHQGEDEQQPVGE